LIALAGAAQFVSVIGITPGITEFSSARNSFTIDGTQVSSLRPSVLGVRAGGLRVPRVSLSWAHPAFCRLSRLIESIIHAFSRSVLVRSSPPPPTISRIFYGYPHFQLIHEGPPPQPRAAPALKCERVQYAIAAERKTADRDEWFANKSNSRTWRKRNCFRFVWLKHCIRLSRTSSKAVVPRRDGARRVFFGIWIPLHPERF
jgi:hypothetical protein